jgi:hypothetical protein
MSIVYLCGLGFSGVTQTFKMLPSKYTETSVWHGKPFANRL